MATNSYKFDRQTNGQVKMTTTTAGGSTMIDYIIAPKNFNISNVGGDVCINEDNGKKVMYIPGSQITQINTVAFSGTTDQAVDSLGQNVFY
jgi:hypothetical protein